MSFNTLKLIDQMGGMVEALIPKVLAALIIWIIGSIAIKWSYKVFKKVLDAKEFDPSIETFFLSFIQDRSANHFIPNNNRCTRNTNYLASCYASRCGSCHRFCI
jgi:hypothetical protein